MPSHLVGEIAALGTSTLWTLGAILFASAGRRIGALSVNAFRIVAGAVLLGVTHLLTLGTVIPNASNSQWLYMGLSGIIGLVLGDLGYFSALVIIGPRRSVLLMSLAPIFSAILAYFVLGEILGIWAIIGILITLSGVGLVILEREEKSSEVSLSKSQKIKGNLFGLVGSLGQGIGLVFSKYGMVFAAQNSKVPLNPLSATLIRMIVAAAFIWFFLLILGKLPHVMNSFKDKKGLSRALGGAVTGPFLGVWLSMIAVTFTHTGIAATLMSLMPVFIIPLLWILYRQKTNWRGSAGAVIAVGGVAILFLLGK
jgi:drug/metabolite transporter (DMT)-like permease